MLCNDRAMAMKYTKKPYLVCRSAQPFMEIYHIPDSALPALNVESDPMSLVSKQELYALKRKYKIPNRLITQISNMYKKNEQEIDFGDEPKLEHVLFWQELEALILGKVKCEYRNESCNFLPYYDLSELGTKTMHTALISGSGVGKTWTTARILEANFEGVDIYVFSPTATKDKSYIELKKKLGKKVRLINSNSVNVRIPLSELERGCCLVVDDIDSTSEPAKSYIAELQSKLYYEGRHYTSKDGRGCCVFGIYHDAFAIGKNTSIKASSIECNRIVLFPRDNKNVATKFLQKRLHWTNKEIKEAYSFLKRNDRFMCIYTHVPNLIMTAHGVKLL